MESKPVLVEKTTQETSEENEKKKKKKKKIKEKKKHLLLRWTQLFLQGELVNCTCDFVGFNLKHSLPFSTALLYCFVSKYAPAK